jgi:hypothetical protein
MYTEKTPIIKMEGFKITDLKKYDKKFKEQVALRIISYETTACRMAEELGCATQS